MKKKLDEMETELEELKTEAETSEEVPTIDTSEMETDIREAEELVEDAKKRHAAAEAEIEAMHPAIDECKNKLEEVTARNEKVIDDFEAAEKKVEDIVKVRVLRTFSQFNACSPLNNFTPDTGQDTPRRSSREAPD